MSIGNYVSLEIVFLTKLVLWSRNVVLCIRFLNPFFDLKILRTIICIIMKM